MTRIIKTNYSDPDLYCVYCKERIAIGEKYIIVFEAIWSGREIEKTYHLDCDWGEE
ncbi:MAG: hypothetical protein PVG65_00575 [Candidatus Thorarchaeota archaeon]|jgi:hypothetical protein